MNTTVKFLLAFLALIVCISCTAFVVMAYFMVPHLLQPEAFIAPPRTLEPWLATGAPITLATVVGAQMPVDHYEILFRR